MKNYFNLSIEERKALRDKHIVSVPPHFANHVKVKTTIEATTINNITDEQ